jgi:hypothetical protein
MILGGQLVFCSNILVTASGIVLGCSIKEVIPPAIAALILILYRLVRKSRFSKMHLIINSSRNQISFGINIMH